MAIFVSQVVAKSQIHKIFKFQNLTVFLRLRPIFFLMWPKDTYQTLANILNLPIQHILSIQVFGMSDFMNIQTAKMCLCIYLPLWATISSQQQVYRTSDWAELVVSRLVIILHIVGVIR